MTITEKLSLDDLYFNLFNTPKKIKVGIYVNDDMKFPGKYYYYTLEIVDGQYAILKSIEE